MKLKKNNQKGFTLVELIVVIVIIGVLAAITVPALMGYIDEGDMAQDQVNARTAYLAAQTIATQGRAKSDAEFATLLTDSDIQAKLNDLDGIATYGTTIGGENTYTVTLNAEGQVSIEYKGKQDELIVIDVTTEITPPAGE